MECPKCSRKLKKVMVKVQDAKSPALSYQCGNCGYFEFDQNSSEKVIREIQVKEAALKIRQKIIKLSHDRLGLYLNKDIVRSLKLRGGEDVNLSVPDEKHIVVEVE